MIDGQGWRRHNIWEHSASVRELYTRRCRLEAEEMTCHAQAVRLLAPHVTAGDILLDAGCGSGYFYHSLRKRDIPVEYFGVDATQSFIDIGKKHLPTYGLAGENLLTMRLEDLDGEVDHVVCINVLSNIDNYHRPLERLLEMSRKTVILRESCSESASYAYVTDRFLDEGAELRVHVNTYAIAELTRFIESYGFDAQVVRDERTGDGAEVVIGYPHYWKFVVCTRRIGTGPVR